MDRHFTLPIAIAAALHGLIFLVPRTPAPAGPDTGPTRIEPGLPLRPTIILTDNRTDQTDDGATTAPNGGGEEVPKGIDTPAANGPGFQMNVETVSPRVSAGEVMKITGRICTGTGVGDGPGSVATAAMLDRTPRARIQIAPNYPAAARTDGRSGEVVLEFVVDETGHVLEPRIVNSTDSVFNEAALRAITKWRFEPGTIKSIPVRFRMALPVLFHLDD